MLRTLKFTRRRFLAHTGALSALAVTNSQVFGVESSPPSFKLCAFEKFLQDLSYDELAEVIAELGFDGIEATVRKNGHVVPERVEEDLPKLVEALQEQDLEITVMATDVVSTDQPLTEKVLRTAASLGVQRYRMGYYTYDAQGSVTGQLDKIKPVLKDLAALNRELGISALYQNHSGARYMGATLWDLHQLIRDIPVEEIGCAFDIHHATAEAGLSWPVLYRLMLPHIGAIYVKDYRWQDRKVADVELGTGQVDPAFFKMVKQGSFSGPISLHVEYLEHESTDKNIAALKRDLGVLQGWLTNG